MDGLKTEGSGLDHCQLEPQRYRPFGAKSGSTNSVSIHAAALLSLQLSPRWWMEALLSRQGLEP